LSHDFQQSYLVAGASGQLAAFSESLYGPSRFEIRCAVAPARAEPGGGRASTGAPAGQEGELRGRVTSLGVWNDANARGTE
jgi:hypothetical protein